MKILTLALAFIWITTANAANLLSARPGGRFVSDQNSLNELRLSKHYRTTVPLADGATADVVLIRFSPWKNTRIEIHSTNGVRSASPPNTHYYRGTAVDDPEARVFLAVSEKSVRGVIAKNGKLFRFGPSQRDGDEHVAAQVDLAPLADYTPQPPLLSPEPPISGLVAEPLVGPLRADIAIETDYELWSHFGSDDATLVYLGDLIAAASAIYERDTQVSLNLSYVRIWSTPSDPWTGTTTGAALTELYTYWRNAANGLTTVRRATVHFVSAKPLGGGLAYLGTLCQAYGYGVSQVYGSFNLLDPSRIWDVLVVSHEIGHNFSSPHTHCYVPPVDMCYNLESGCYNGPVVTSRGTIMGYCHLRGGVSNVSLEFGGVVAGRIRQGAENAGCLTRLNPTTTTITSTTTITTTTTTSTSTTTTRLTTTTTSTSPTTTTTAPTTSTSTTVTAPTSTTSSTIPPPPPPACKPKGERCKKADECCSQKCRRKPPIVGKKKCR